MQLIEIKRDQLDQFLADLSWRIGLARHITWGLVPMPIAPQRVAPRDAPPDLTLLQARALCRAINEALRLTAPKVLDIAIQLNGSTWRIDVSDGSKFEFSYFENI